MNLYDLFREALGMSKQADADMRSEPEDPGDVFLIRHRNPDGTVSYEATEDLMKAAALAANRVPPPDFDTVPNQADVAP